MGHRDGRVGSRPLGLGRAGCDQKWKNVPFDDNLVSRPGPRLVAGLEALAKMLHPELFQ